MQHVFILIASLLPMQLKYQYMAYGCTCIKLSNTSENKGYCEDSKACSQLTMSAMYIEQKILIHLINSLYSNIVTMVTTNELPTSCSVICGP